MEVANTVVMGTHLTQVRFSGFSAHAHVATAIDDLDLCASTRFRRPVVSRERAGFTATSTLLFRLDATPSSSEPAEDGQPCVVAKATLEAAYAFRPESTDFSDEQLETFALHYCPFHVWGYWREFVQSSLARLEWPPMTLPLFRIDMAEELVMDELE